MALLNIAPTKSSLLTLKHQLAVAEEGYDLLEQKRQILVFELIKRLDHARALERQIDETLPRAFAAIREASLDIGSRAIEQAAAGVHAERQITISTVHLMGLRLPRVAVRLGPTGLPFGVGGTSVNTDTSQERFTSVLPLLAELAEAETTMLRLATELRRTQRRCNALSKIFIPNYRQTISVIVLNLEEREREAFVMTRMIRDRLSVEACPPG